MVTTTILLALSLAANAVTATPVRIPQIQALEEASDINTTTAVAVPEDNQLANNNHIVAARGEPINGTLICGNFPNGKGLRARALIDALREGDLRDHQYHLDPHGCNRVNCWHKTGIHVCNVCYVVLFFFFPPLLPTPSSHLFFSIFVSILLTPDT